MRGDAERERDWSRVPTSFAGVAFVAIGWLFFYGMLVLYEMREPYQQRVEKALAVADEMYGSHWASATRTVLLPGSPITIVH
jgi:hypothetical protein